MGTCQNISELLNIREEDLSILETQITPNADGTEYYQKVNEDYDSGKVITISAMEYKNFVLLDYFVKQILSSNIDKWINYDSSKKEAIRAYRMTWNIANNTIDKLNNKNEESKIVKVKSEKRNGKEK